MTSPRSGEPDPAPRPEGTGVPPEAPDESTEESTEEGTEEGPEESPERAAERALVRRAQAGDEAAFEQLVRAHQQRAFRIARNMVPLDEDARDLVQEAFLRVFRSLERFDFQHAFGTWLHRIVTNLAIDHLRRRRLALSTAAAGDGEEEGGELDLPDTDLPGPSRRLEAEETAQRVRDCIASLAPHFQAVLTLRELEGLPCTEIARLVGATHVTVRWRLHRGRKLFQEEWERRERLEDGAAGRPNSRGGQPVQAPEDHDDPR